jgi:mono/diheme cytochrome c family protein
VKRFTLACLAIGTAACQPLPSAAPAMAARQVDGLAFAQGSCGGCHAVERYRDSPNPNAPPFARIVNQPNLTAASLSSWLRDAHNYPAEMEFYLEGGEVDNLVAYMLTLREPAYRPPI